jgi:hypothetical protein
VLNLKVDTKEFSKLVALTKKAQDNLVSDAHDFFVKETPIRSGNARLSTFHTKNSIVADYPYAQRLDEGWSRQSPEGMTQPTIDYIENTLIPNALRRISSGK